MIVVCLLLYPGACFWSRKETQNQSQYDICWYIAHSFSFVVLHTIFLKPCKVSFSWPPTSSNCSMWSQCSAMGIGIHDFIKKVNPSKRCNHIIYSSISKRILILLVFLRSSIAANCQSIDQFLQVAMFLYFVPPVNKVEGTQAETSLGLFVFDIYWSNSIYDFPQHVNYSVLHLTQVSLHKNIRPTKKPCCKSNWIYWYNDRVFAG